MPTEKTRFGLVDFVLIAALALLTAFVYYRLNEGLHYHWNWDLMPQYLLREDAGRWVPNLLLQGFLTTVRLSVWATLVAIVIGSCMALCRVSGKLFWRLIGRSYVELMRNLPPLVLVFIFYFFLSEQILAIIPLEDFVHHSGPQTRRMLEFFFAPPARFGEFVAAVITLGLYEGAYMTEIIRAGIISVEKGQWEASSALGLSWLQTMRHVVFPQATRQILPPLAGQLVSAIKDSAIVSVISIQELTFQGMELMAATYLTFEIWLTITALYFILTFSCSLAVRRLEVFMQRGYA